MKKQPEQTRATRQKFLDAFWNLYQKKSIDKITVGELTRSAGFNRGTFYEYFIDIYDLLNQAEDELLSEIRVEMKVAFHDGISNDLGEYSVRCALVFKKFDDRIFLLLGETGDSKFTFKLQTVFSAIFSSLYQISFDVPHADYVISFIFSSITGVMRHWYEKGKDISEEELLGLLQRLEVNGLKGYLNITLFDKPNA